MAKKHLAFVSSSEKYTEGVLPLARRLESHGYLVHWISFRRFERNWLLQNGVPNDRVLDTIGGFRADRFGANGIAERVGRLENGRRPFINDIILMDRMLRRRSDTFARAYLAHIEDTVTAFLLDKNITLISGGRDNALQISCSKIGERLGIPYVVPTVVRMPDDRFGYCRGHLDSEFIKLRDVTKDDVAMAQAFLDSFRADKPIPAACFFEARNARFLRRVHRDFGMWATAGLRGLHDRDNDFTRYTLGRLWRMFWRRRLNAAHVRAASVFEPLGDRPFLLYGVQMQPESSIDVVASFFSDQHTLITQIARSIPSTHELYVKPHQDHVGGLSRRELMALKAIPGVRLIEPNQKSHDLIMRAAVVLTPTGTMAFEAALHGVPSVIFAPEFFRKVPGVHYCETPTALPELLTRLIHEPRLDRDEETVQFLASIFASSFVGRQTNYLGEFSDDELHDLRVSYDILYDCLHGSAGRSAAAVGELTSR